MRRLFNVKMMLVVFGLLGCGIGTAVGINGVPVLVQSSSGSYSIKATYAGAVAAADTANKTIYVMGYTPVAADLTVPVTRATKIVFGGYFDVASGKKLTIDGPFEGAEGCFRGAGSYALGVHIPVYPSYFTGTDAQKIQKALDTALNQPRLNYNAAQIEHNQVWFDRQYNITGSSLKFNKASAISESADRRVLRMAGKGGGITKTDGGLWFTKGDSVNTVTGDIVAENMNFIGLQGAGGVVWDAGTLIRVSSSYNTYKDVDTISATRTTSAPGSYPSFAQSFRFDHDHVTGGVGKLHYWKSDGDCKVTSCLVENRNADASGGFIHNTPIEADTAGQVRNTSLVVRDNVIENFNGDSIKLGATVASVFEGNYGESITGYHIDFATLQELNHYGVTVQGNLFQATPAQVTAGMAAIKWSKIAGGVVSIGNFRNSLAPIHEIVPPPGGGYGILTSINDYSTVATAATDPAYINNLSGVIETTDAKSYGRLKQKTASLTEAYGGTLNAGSVTAFVFTFEEKVRPYDIVSASTAQASSLTIAAIRTPTNTNNVTVYVHNRSGSPVTTYTITATAIGLTALGDN